MEDDSNKTSASDDVNVDQAGRGQEPLEGMPGINVVKSIGQDEWDTYSNKSSHGSSS